MLDKITTLNEYGMQTANLVLVYAWAGWALIMMPTLFVLLATGWVLKCVANKLAENMMTVYRLSAIQHYFHLMEKNGTHSLRKEVVKPVPKAESDSPKTKGRA